MRGGGRGLAFPRMRLKSFALVLGGLLLVCLGAGLGMRASLTDFNASEETLMGLAFRPSPATEGMVGLYTSQDVVREMEESGLNPDDYTLEEAQELFTMAMDNVEDIASVVVVGTFTGERTYAYEAFRCEVEVSAVVKGSGVEPGDTVFVYDPFMIREPGATASDSGGMFASERIVSANPDHYLGGTPPLREGQEYLLFLEEKSYPAGLAAPAGGRAYVLADHPYSRIATDAAEHPERDRVISLDELEVVEHDWGTEYVMPQMTFGEACGYDVFVQTQEAAELYRATCREICRRCLPALIP